MANELFVTLETSDNQHLPYPCKGWLELFEVGSNGNIIVGIFRRLKDDTVNGRFTENLCPVEVRHAKFTYDCNVVYHRKY